MAGLASPAMGGSSRVRTRGLFVAAWLVTTLPCLVPVGAALAAEPSVPMRIDYQADTTCPSRSELIRQVLARTGQARRAQGREPAWQFAVRISVEPGRVRGSLAGHDPSGRFFDRHLTGRDCDEVVEALALILALTVDAGARTDPASSLPAPSGRESRVMPPSEAPVLPPTPSAAPSSPEPPPGRWAVGGGIHALLAVGIAPEPLPGVEAFIDAARLGASGWRPSLRASARRAQAGGMQLGGGEVSFALTVGALEACPTTVGLSRLFAVYPCAYGEWGTLRAVGSQVPEPRSVSRMWLSLGPAVRADLLLAKGLRLETRLALDVPLRRGRFWFLPEMIHEVDPVGLRWGLGLVARFR